MYNFMGLNGTAGIALQPNVSCTCNCKRSLFQSMEIILHILLLQVSSAEFCLTRRTRGRGQLLVYIEATYNYEELGM
ncbi:hypothetical protein Y1Q_0002693 [Alligator mississippiensis]|uniref:Uncharacterized protein n=1 Tax=Alligator mississippiensis TaxID=8496 RepID=A0A151NZ76_ALLMI|nr:hypothetical protein Y1Q_0002693 [Alligator mississippiensis]